MKFSFIIPTYNNVVLLQKCLESLRKFHLEDEVIIVDDASPDERVILFEKYFSQKYNCKLIKNEKNSGFSKTVNAGIRASTGDIVILVNNDVEFITNITCHLDMVFNDDSAIGIVGGLLFYPDKTIQHAGILKINVSPQLSYWTHCSWHKFLKNAPEAGISRYMLACTGALLAIRRETLNDIGLLNENFFLAFEDTEICLRAWSNSWKVFYCSDIWAYHHEGATRGNTLEKKKIINGGGWLKKELEGHKVFKDICKNIDFLKIESSIDFYNNFEIKNNILIGINNINGSVCIKRTGALGDVILLTPVIENLKKKYPKIKINIITNFVSVFLDNPFVDNVYTDNVSNVIEASNYFYDLDLEYEKNPYMHPTDAYSQKILGCTTTTRAKLYGTKKNPFTRDIADSLGLDFINNVPDFVTINMSQSWPARTLEIQKWENIITHILSKNLKVLALGTSKDIVPTSREGVYCLYNKTSLHAVRFLIENSKLFIGMDSGLFHVAACTNVPVIGIFTCVNPKYREHPRDNTFFITPLRCGFCLHGKNPPVTFLKCSNKKNQNECCKSISEQQIKNTINIILGGK